VDGSEGVKEVKEEKEVKELGGVEVEVEVEEEQMEEQVEPPAAPKIGWARYVDDNGWPYFYNWNTGVSTYDNPFEYSDSDEDSDKEDADRLRKELEARAFMEFCAIMVQARFRGQVERRRCRETMAKRFRKHKAGGGEYCYEDLDTGKVLKKRPSIIKMLWPGSKF
jgi:hypothetical protein